MSDREAALRAGMAAIWVKSLPHVRKQLDVLEQVAIALLDNTITDEFKREGEREAHRLTGSAGSFGFQQASADARAIEHMLQPGGNLDARRMSELVIALRRNLDTEELPSARPVPPADPDVQTTRVLIVEDDGALSAAISAALKDRNSEGIPAATLREARAICAEHGPDIILLDINLGMDNGLDLLDDARVREARIPVLVMTSRGEFADRVGAARRGARAFLEKPMPPGEIARYALDFAARAHAATPRILAVDDDQATLGVIRALLRNAGFQVNTLADPRGFWSALKDARPDVLLLDYEMPHVNGVELCKVVRNDPSWRALPIIFVTSRTDPEAVTEIFTSGADDLVGKPIVSAELIARVRNRVERSHLLRQLSDTDYLTGLKNRRSSIEQLETYQQLADKYQQSLSLGIIELETPEDGSMQSDEAVVDFARELRTTFLGDDVIARWGYATFAVGMYGMSRVDAVERLGQLLNQIEQRGLRFSAGVVQYGLDGADIDALAEVARERLLSAKQAGGGRVMRAMAQGESNVVDVLVVEDDEAIAELLMHALETRGYRVHRIIDGPTAIDAVAGPNAYLRPKVVLLDVDLPGLDGISVLRAWSDRGVLMRTRVIMLTVRSSEPEVVEVLKLNAFDHVAKPFSTTVLMQRVRRALET